MRCQYCGKNLWPLRGMFDGDFCSKDHRQRYHERVRKALEHLPKAEGAPRASGIADFQFEKPRLQEVVCSMRRTDEPCDHPYTPSLPDFALTAASASFASGSFSFASVSAVGGARPSIHAAATAITPKVTCIETLRERFHQSHGALAVAMIDSPAGIAPEPGNMNCKASQRWGIRLETFDELNHVYLHEPDPILEAGLPLNGSLATQIQPLSTTSQAKHTASAGPSGRGRLEFFPMPSRFHAAHPAVAEAEATLPEMASTAGENIWLEDLMSWRVPVALAPTRSSLAMLPAVDRAAAVERFRNTQTSASGAAPLEWPFATQGMERRPFQAARPGMAPAIVIEFPAVRMGAAAPLSDEVAVFDAANFNLQIPEIAVDTSEMDLLVESPADVAPARSRTTRAQASKNGTPLARGTNWLPMQTESVLPARALDLSGALAEPKLGGLVAKAASSAVRNGAQSVKAGLPISLPNRAVRLKNGPDFFMAEPVVADSVALPVTAKAFASAAPLAMPDLSAADSGMLLQPASSQALLPAGAFRNEVALNHAAEAVETASIYMPAVEPQQAGFGQGELKKIDLWCRDYADRTPHQFGWMEPQLALHIPESHYEDYPLALQVDVPEPRTVTVFETATYDPQINKVVSMNEARPKRWAVPSYLKGMAAGLMLASFLWFGSSSIRSDGITLRPGDLIRLTIQRRAVYEVGDNFHAGLASWDGKNFGKTWNYDREGFVRPGRLAIYKPSRDMKDYKLEFLAQIERKGVNWVVRAADDQNYYGMKLAVTEPGPRPLVALTRYSVIDGKRESRGETPLQVMMHNNRPYRVEVDVRGNRFLTSIEGQLVDSWSDDRLKSGGVGFFTEGSEKARLYWMKVTKNSDFLGKLCSILVPKES